MSGLFNEPREVRALGDLYANVWQVAYVTRDLDEGMALLRKHYGVESTEVPTDGATFLAGDEPAEWDVRISMGARGGLIVELIEPVGGEVDFYRRFLPPDGVERPRLPPPRHLHAPRRRGVGRRSATLLAASGLRVDYTVLIPDRVRAGYVDTTAELGHFLEVCQLQSGRHRVLHAGSSRRAPDRARRRGRGRRAWLRTGLSRPTWRSSSAPVGPDRRRSRPR